MKKCIKIALSILLLGIVIPGHSSEKEKQRYGEVKLAPVFGSHMVLQQNEPINIWGEATPGELVYVELDGNSSQTKANRQGEWMVSFPARKASHEALTLKVNQLRLNDILIGEVWICSGQSNMGYPLKYIENGKALLEEAQIEELRLLKHTNIRIVAKEGYTNEELSRCNTRDFFQAEWTGSTKESAASASAVAWLFGKGLLQKLDVPVGIIQVAVGGSAMNNWIPPQALKENPATASLFEKDWLSNEDVRSAHRSRAREAFQTILNPDEPYIVGKTPYRWLCEPGFLFEAGIAPLKKLSFRGVFWYQGESDTENMKMIDSAAGLFPLLVNQWRSYLNMGDFPFIYVQLPGYNSEGWAEFREIQRQAEKEIKNSAMVVTIDLGDENNVHTKDKQPLGERAVQLALKNVYGFTELTGFPEVKRWKVKDSEITLEFRECGQGLLDVEGPIPGFEVADSKGLFYAAEAKIVGPHKVLIMSPLVDPTSLRYGWAPFPKPPLKLFNSETFPVGPFLIELDK